MGFQPPSDSLLDERSRGGAMTIALTGDQQDLAEVQRLHILITTTPPRGYLDG
jgi:hypothetical protein